MGTEEPSARQYTRVQISIRRGAHPIEGIWRDADSSEPTSFWGWLELISALEKVRATDLDRVPDGRSIASVPTPADEGLERADAAQAGMRSTRERNPRV